MKKTIAGEILLPIRRPLSSEEEWEEPMQQAIKELVGIGHVPIPYSDTLTADGLIDLDSSEKHYQGYLTRLRKSKGARFSILRISCRVPSDPLPHYDIKGVLLGHDREINYAALDDSLFQRASALVIISNLSIPGSLGIYSPATFIDGKLYSEYPSMMPDVIRFAWEGSDRIGWPVLQSIPISTTLQWLSSPEWLLDKSGGTPLLRALSAFTHLFSDKPDPNILGIVYALMGIEALYTSGKEESISEQIVKKTQVFLGEGTGIKKRIGRMYAFRSKVVHGQVDFPPCFAEMSDEQHEVVGDTIDIAVAILLATLQKMIVSSVQTLTFEYTVRELSKD